MSGREIDLGVIVIEMVLEAMGSYQVTKRGGVDREGVQAHSLGGRLQKEKVGK